SYSAGRFAGARAALAWHGTLSEMGMVVISSSIAVGSISQTLSVEGSPIGAGGKALQSAFPRFVDDLSWCAESAKSQRAPRNPPFGAAWPCACRLFDRLGRHTGLEAR